MFKRSVGGRRRVATFVVASMVAAGFAVAAAPPASAAPFTGRVSPTAEGGLLDLNGDNIVSLRDDSNAFYGDTAIIDGFIDCNGWGGTGAAFENNGSAGDGVITVADDCTLKAFNGTGPGLTINVVDGVHDFPDGAFPTTFPANDGDYNDNDIGNSAFAWSTINGLVDANGDEQINANDCAFGVIHDDEDAGLGAPVDGLNILGNTQTNTNPCGFGGTPPSASNNGKVDLNADNAIDSADTCANGCFLSHNVTLGVVQQETPFAGGGPPTGDGYSGGFSPTIIGGLADLNGDGVVNGRDDSNAHYGDTHIIDGSLDCNAWTSDNHGAAGNGIIDLNDDCTLIGYDTTVDGEQIDVVDGEFQTANGPLPTTFNAGDPDNNDVSDSDFGWSAINGRVDSNGDEFIGNECHFGLIGETVDAGAGDMTDGADILGDDGTNPCGFATPPGVANNGLVDLDSNVVINALDSCTGCFFGLNLSNGFVTGPTLSIDDVTVAEGNAGTVAATFTVTLSAPSTNTVTVDADTADNTATAPNDYTANTGSTLTFAPGDTSESFTVNVNGDNADEADETFFVNLSNPSNAGILDGQGAGTITDDDPSPTLAINDVTVAEGDAGNTPATFTVTMSGGPTNQTVTVDAATADNTATAGSDYTAAAGTLTFVPGDTSEPFTVNVTGDTLDELDETFNVNLTNPSNASIADGQGVGTITDDDPGPTIAIDDVTVTEGDAGTTAATFTVSLSAPSSQTVTVDAASANNTAVAPDDYATTAGTVTFAPGDTSEPFTVNVNGDTLDEGDETYFVNLTNATNASIADGQGVGTITDDDPATATLSINDVTVTEGNAGTTAATFTVTLSQASGQTVTVDAATANNTAVAPGDYATTAGTVTFAPGDTSESFTVNVNGDTIDEVDETFFVNLTNASNASISDSQGVGTITDDDPGPTLAINDVTVTEGNAGTTAATFTVTLSAPSGQIVTVDAGTANNTAVAPGDYATTAGTLTFAPGDTSEPFTVNVNGDTIDEGNETYFVNLTNATNASIADAQGVGTITDDDPPSVSINDVTQVEGDKGSSKFIFTVTLSQAMPNKVTLRATTADGSAQSAVKPKDFAKRSKKITFKAGVTSKTFIVKVKGDLNIEPNETFTVNLTELVGIGAGDTSGLGTITNDDP